LEDHAAANDPRLTNHLPSDARRDRQSIAPEPAYPPFLALLDFGLVVRVLVMIAYSAGGYARARFARIALRKPFGDFLDAGQHLAEEIF
jgi:hypothetical protein